MSTKPSTSTPTAREGLPSRKTEPTPKSPTLFNWEEKGEKGFWQGVDEERKRLQNDPSRSAQRQDTAKPSETSSGKSGFSWSDMVSLASQMVSSEAQRMLAMKTANVLASVPDRSKQPPPNASPPKAAGGVKEAIAGLFKRWRVARAEAAGKRAELESLFDYFLRETEPLVPEGSKHPDAALYRHAWKRAAILGIIYQERSDERLTTLYKEFERLAGERYFAVAPAGLYGKAPLVMGERTGTRLLELEKQRLFPTEGKLPRIRPLACIYVGTCEKGRVYVGQTVGAPESRWVQHRCGGTGPFKNGELYVVWKVVEGGINPAKLDERESYYIGFYNADKEGYNETRGKDWKAYERGQAERRRVAARGQGDAATSGFVNGASRL